MLLARLCANQSERLATETDKLRAARLESKDFVLITEVK